MFFLNSFLSPTGELLPRPHPADEDEPHLLLVPGLPLLLALGPPGGAVPAGRRRPALCDGDQRHRRGHGREEQLLWRVSHQLDGGAQQPAAVAVRPIKRLCFHFRNFVKKKEKEERSFCTACQAWGTPKTLRLLAWKAHYALTPLEGDNIHASNKSNGVETVWGQSSTEHTDPVWNGVTIYGTWTHTNNVHTSAFRLSTRAAIFADGLLPSLGNSRSNTFVYTFDMYCCVRCVAIPLMRKLRLRRRWIPSDCCSPRRSHAAAWFLSNNVLIIFQFLPVEGKRDGTTNWKPTWRRPLLPVRDSAVSLLINWVFDSDFSPSRLPVLHMWRAGDGEYSRYSHSLFFALVFPIKSAVHVSAMCWSKEPRQ